MSFDKNFSAANELENELETALETAPALPRESLLQDELVPDELVQDEQDSAQDLAQTAAQDSAQTAARTKAEQSIDIRYLKKAQEAISDFLKNQSKKLFSLIAIFLIGFQFVFGTLALATFLIWVFIIFALTAIQRLNASYKASVNADGIEILRNDNFGQDRLFLPWNKLESVARYRSEDENQNQKQGQTVLLRLQLKKQSLSFYEGILFQDLFESPGTLSLSGKQLELDEQAGEFKAAEFLNRLSQFCGASMVDLKEADSALNKTEEALLCDAAWNRQNLVIDYQPLKRFHNKNAFVLKRCEKAVFLILAFIAALALLKLGASRFLYLAVCLVTVPVALMSLNLRKRLLKLLFTPEGISIVWLDFGNYLKGKALPWEAIEYVRPVAAKNKSKSPEQKIEFKISSRLPDSAHVKMLALLAPFMVKKHRDCYFLQLDPACFSDSASRPELLSVLKNYLPAERLDPELAEKLNPTDTLSYTKLWLDSFSKDTSARRFDGALEPGRQLANGKFEIKSFLGAGGQANVYIARLNHGYGLQAAEPAALESADTADTANTFDTADRAHTADTVVLKEFILPSHAGAELSLRSLEHIKKEFELMKNCSHNNLVRYYDLFVEDHRSYLVLEHVNGRSLKALVEEQGALAEKQVLELAVQMARILKYLHGLTPALIHRDFTPENLILAEDGTLKLIDFNVAQQLEEESTRTIVGKHAYLPPEQFRGRACEQSDIYALAASLYFLLTGEEPEAISSSHPLLRNESVSLELDELVAYATEPELSRRMKSALELEERLAAILKETEPAKD